MRSRRSSDRFNLPDGIVIDRAAFGLIGIGTMGSNLALNFEDHGIPVAFWNREQEKTRSFALDFSSSRRAPPTRAVKRYFSTASSRTGV